MNVRVDDGNFSLLRTGGQRRAGSQERTAIDFYLFDLQFDGVVHYAAIAADSGHAEAHRIRATLQQLGRKTDVFQLIAGATQGSAIRGGVVGIRQRLDVFAIH